jgi:hypothetical protein
LEGSNQVRSSVTYQRHLVPVIKQGHGVVLHAGGPTDVTEDEDETVRACVARREAGDLDWRLRRHEERESDAECLTDVWKHHKARRCLPWRVDAYTPQGRTAVAPIQLLCPLSPIRSRPFFFLSASLSFNTLPPPSLLELVQKT